MNAYQEMDMKRTVISASRAQTALANSLQKLEAQLEEIGIDVERMRDLDGPITRLNYGEIKTWAEFKAELEEYEVEESERQ